MNLNSFKGKIRALSMVFALVVIWIIFQAVTDGAFLQARNLSNLLRQMAVTGVLAVGMTLIIVAGHIDLSVGSVVAFLGALMALLGSQHGWDPTLMFVAALAGGTLIGTIQGYLTAYQKIPAFIVTLGGMMVFRGASMWITSNSTIPLDDHWLASIGTAYLSPNQGWGLTILGVIFSALAIARSHQSRVKYGLESFSWFRILAPSLLVSALLLGFMSIMASYQGIPVPVLIMLGLMLLFHFISLKTTWGRHVYAIGGNGEAAHLSGIRVPFRLMSIFTLMGLLSGVAGVILTARVGSASPDAGQLLELDAIASCVIGGTSLMGGKGSILGAILGALVMESLNNGMSLANMEPFWQYVLKGLVLVAAVWVDIFSQDKSR